MTHRRRRLLAWTGASVLTPVPGEERRYRVVKDPSGDQAIEVLFATEAQHAAYEALKAKVTPRRLGGPDEEER
ncbi:MAG: hypothetical protein HY721_33160 [Planctomycetes bacterium]|nr:hypothetical protein [Planctomycetota bacterium]